MNTKYIHITTVDNSPSQNLALIGWAEYDDMKSGAQVSHPSGLQIHTDKDK